jgi:SmpA / OmlA family
MLKLLTLISLVFTLCGCQSMIYGRASDTDQLKLGMTKAQVIEVMGSPVSTEVDEHQERLIFKKMKHTVSMWPRTFEVTLRDNAVVKWGEQYQEQNVNSF